MYHLTEGKEVSTIISILQEIYHFLWTLHLHGLHLERMNVIIT